MKTQFSVRDIMRILHCSDQAVLTDVKLGNIVGHKVPNKIRGRRDPWVFSFSETACYINTKRRKRHTA